MIKNIDAIKRHIREIITSADVDVVEENIAYSHGVLNVRLLVDYPSGGIDINTCSRLNKKIVDYLESIEGVISDYTVEISSPGLDRKLKGKRDFHRVRGQTVEVLLNEKVNGKGQWKGVLSEVSDEGISIETKKGKASIWILIPYDKIQQGRVVL